MPRDVISLGIWRNADTSKPDTVIWRYVFRLKPRSPQDVDMELVLLSNRSKNLDKLLHGSRIVTPKFSRIQIEFTVLEITHDRNDFLDDVV
jgi:hypothetical protein